MLHQASPKLRRVRPHRAPFPLTETAERFEGGEILSEFAGDLAVVLWKSYKNVMLWSGVPAEERAGLFSEGAGQRRREDVRAAPLETPLVPPLHRIAEMLDSPAAADARRVAFACRQISDWCVGRGAGATGLLFMQAAALSNPRDADAACAVGRMARARAEYARAESWFRQAVVSAREVRDWSSYTRANIGLGKVFWQRGGLPAARRCMQRAYRTATRHHLHDLRGWSLSDLGGIAIHTGNWEEAAGWIRGAMEIYGAGHPLSRRLVNDLAYAWITAGWFEPALRMLDGIAHAEGDPGEMICVWGSVARAAGGAGDSRGFDRAVGRIRELADHPDARAAVPDAWLDVAHGASTAGHWEIAQAAAERALHLAIAQGEGRVRLEAESTLASIMVERMVAARPRTGPSPAPDTIRRMADEVTGSLGRVHEASAMTAPAW